MTDLRTLTNEELLRVVDRSNPEVRELALRWETLRAVVFEHIEKSREILDKKEAI